MLSPYLEHIEFGHVLGGHALVLLLIERAGVHLPHEPVSARLLQRSDQVDDVLLDQERGAAGARRHQHRDAVGSVPRGSGSGRSVHGSGSIRLRGVSQRAADARGGGGGGGSGIGDGGGGGEIPRTNVRCGIW